MASFLPISRSRSDSLDEMNRKNCGPLSVRLNKINKKPALITQKYCAIRASFNSRCHLTCISHRRPVGLSVISVTGEPEHTLAHVPPHQAQPLPMQRPRSMDVPVGRITNAQNVVKQKRTASAARSTLFRCAVITSLWVLPWRGFRLRRRPRNCP